MIASVFTLGCKVNSYESDSLIQGLKSLGYDVTNQLEYADLYIINTCAVTNEAEKKSRQTIARVRKFNKNAKIIIMGCASEKSPNDFLDKQNVILVTGAKSKSRVFELIKSQSIGCHINNLDNEYDEMLSAFSSNTRAYIKIQDGCNNFCSYCIIPYLRGKSRSRKIENILAEINQCNALEVVLTGINITSFNDSGKSLMELLNALKNIDKRIRLGSIEQSLITTEFLTDLKQIKNFAPHFHLSLQSGSDKVLKEMNRKYSAEDFLNKCKLIRTSFENSAITTDIISGFPTETDEDFIDTLNFMEKVSFSQVHCFSYSVRTGTNAAKLKQLDDKIKNDRHKQILSEAEKLRLKYLKENIGKKLNVLFEDFKDGYSIGYSENYIKVYFKGKASGFKTVRASKIFLDGIKGE